jgi:hypothetical protein
VVFFVCNVSYEILRSILTLFKFARCGRWFDVWAMSNLAVRLCSALGLNFSDSLQKPMSNKIREQILIGPPQSHTEVELRRNVFWLAYAHQRYHLFVSPWRAYFPTTLMLYESCTDRVY